MGMDLYAAPVLLIRQSASPSIVAGIPFWRDTDDNTLYFSDGSAWNAFSSASDAQGWETAVAQIVLEMLRLSAEGVLTAPDYDNMFLDYFADADGQDGTINTGSTTAVWATDQYTNSAYDGAVTDAHGETMGSISVSAHEHERGWKINTNKACYVSTITKHADCTATHAVIRNQAATELVKVAFVGNVATIPNYPLANATDYYILVFSTPDYDSAYNDGASMPISDTNFDWVDGWYYYSGWHQDADKAQCIVSVETKDLTPANKIITTDMTTLGFTPSDILIHVKDIALAGTGAITYDVSFDNGSTWDSTDNALDTKIPITDGSTKQMIVIFNLDGVAAGNTASMKDYEVILWSS